jgi:hypothetical protein
VPIRVVSTAIGRRDYRVASDEREACDFAGTAARRARSRANVSEWVTQALKRRYRVPVDIGAARLSWMISMGLRLGGDPLLCHCGPVDTISTKHGRPSG